MIEEIISGGPMWEPGEEPEQEDICKVDLPIEISKLTKLVEGLNRGFGDDVLMRQDGEFLVFFKIANKQEVKP